MVLLSRVPLLMRTGEEDLDLFNLGGSMLGVAQKYVEDGEGRLLDRLRAEAWYRHILAYDLGYVTFLECESLYWKNECHHMS